MHYATTHTHVSYSSWCYPCFPPFGVFSVAAVVTYTRHGGEKIPQKWNSKHRKLAELSRKIILLKSFYHLFAVVWFDVHHSVCVCRLMSCHVMSCQCYDCWSNFYIITTYNHATFHVMCYKHVYVYSYCIIHMCFPFLVIVTVFCCVLCYCVLLCIFSVLRPSPQRKC
jgi:hypothetical protein